jgi:dsDNA-specific endonuclease/ATPase MutS2
MKSAVEWLAERCGLEALEDVISEAKEMEIEQIVQAYANGQSDTLKIFKKRRKMSPKEKTKELFDKFLGYAYDGISSAEENSIECALIAVNEIIRELTEEISPSVHGFRHQYWKQVKDELEKL